MAAAVTITTFAGLAPPWSLSQLDTNVANLQTAIQSQNTYSNFAVDTGAANAYVTTPAAGITATLSAGLIVQFQAIHANTAASTLNHAGLGAKNILNLDGTALTSGQVPLNAIVQVIYDGTQYLLLTPFTMPAPTSGTWTPSVGGTATYTTQSGTWTRLGRLLYIQGKLVINLIGTGSTVVVSGLPLANFLAVDFPISVADTNTVATSVVSITAVVQPSASTIQFLSKTAAGISEATNAIFGNGATVNFAGFYQVAA